MQANDSAVHEGVERSGKIPDLSVSLPIELPRVVMRGALAVAVVGVLLALLLGMWRARADMREETAGALVLAQAMAQLSEAPGTREALLSGLQALSLGSRERHLRLQVRDAAGQALLPAAAEFDTAAPMSWLVALSRRLFPPPVAQTIGWPLRLADGERLRVELIASPDSEQHEALARLLELLALLLAGSALLLAVLRWNVRRSFRPLRPLLDAIAGLEQQRLDPLRALPAMPIRELDAIAAALRHLAESLEQAEAARRLLSRQMLTLQEDERHRIARELHDELGQHLTALRVDAAWLERRLAATPELAAVVDGMGEQCRRIQEELRALLTRLRPLGWVEGGEATPEADGASASGETVARLRALLESLVAAWAQSPGQQTRYALEFGLQGLSEAQVLPRELVLAVYRISQEALTNVARHAGARQAVLRLDLRTQVAALGDDAMPDAGTQEAGMALSEGGADGGLQAGSSAATRRGQPAPARGVIDWSVQDDGCGLGAGAWQRGNGLAGVKERIWAAGGDLQWEPASEDSAAGAGTPGLRLHARLPWIEPLSAGLDSTPALGQGVGA